MSALEWCGIAFLVMDFMLVCTAVYIWSFGPIDLFDDQQAERELDRLILAADAAVGSRPRVRDDISQNI